MPTFQNNRRGQSFIRAIPKINIAGRCNFYGQLTRNGFPFRSKPFNATSIYINGTTRDSAGVALGSCVVQLFRTSDDAIILESTSDVSGNYSFPILVSGTFYIVAYKAGSPDVAGTTVNTLVGA